MCTMTWRFLADGYEVFFNRDEHRARKAARPPARGRRDDVSFLAPADGDFGGTWIAVNEFGLTLCLLNGFPAAGLDVAERSDTTSRGAVPLALAACPNVEAAATALRALPLDAFRPFVAVALAPAHRGFVGSWSGRALDLQTEAPGAQPLVSSSFFTEEVRASRVTVFRRMLRSAADPGASLHLDYHRSHEPERGPLSPCMHRPDAETVSFSRVEVDPGEIRFHYVPCSPCVGRAGAPARLDRAR